MIRFRPNLSDMIDKLEREVLSKTDKIYNKEGEVIAESTKVTMEKQDFDLLIVILREINLNLKMDKLRSYTE